MSGPLKIAVVGINSKKIPTYESYYAEALSAIEGVDVSFVPLDPTLLRDKHPRSEKVIRRHLNDVINKFGAADIVNIHVTLNRFGPTPHASCDNLLKLAAAAPRLVLTMHESPKDKVTLKSELKKLHELGVGGPPAFLMALPRWLASRNHFKAFWPKIRALQKRQSVLLHTFSRFYLQRWQRVHRITGGLVQPPVLLSAAQLATFLDSDDVAKTRREFGVKDGEILIGTFGQFDKNSGIETIVRALGRLPEKYRLLVFGNFASERIALNSMRQTYIDEINALTFHEHSSNRAPGFHNRIRSWLSSFRSVPLALNDQALGSLTLTKLTSLFAREEYVPNLLDVIEEVLQNPEERRRVIFALPKSRDDYFHAMAACNIAVFADSETGAVNNLYTTAATQLCNNVFVTYTPTYLEVKRFCTEGLTIFDAGNPYELAQKLLLARPNAPNTGLARFRESYTPAAMAEQLTVQFRQMVGS